MAVALGAHVEQDELELVELERLVVAVGCLPRPDREGPGEDAWLVAEVEAGVVLAVADGCGGHAGAAEAAALAVGALRDRLLALDGPDAYLRGAILDAFEQADGAIREQGAGGASTLVVAELREDRVRTYHAGDSVALLVGQRGALKHATLSHAPVSYAVEAGLLGEREGLAHEDRHLLTNALGSGDLRIEIGPDLAVAARDTLLLASDGLSDNFLTSELVQRVRTGAPLDRARELADEVRRRMARGPDAGPSKPDDATYLLARRVTARRGSTSGSSRGDGGRRRRS